MKKGFTLAEILITLGIIGVVAALTAPSLVQNAGNAKIGPTLQKTVSTIEIANQQMMVDNEASSLSGVVNKDLTNLQAYSNNKGYKDYVDNLVNYISGSSYEEGQTVEMSQYGGTKYSSITNRCVLHIGNVDVTVNEFDNTGVNYTPKGSYKGAVAQLFVIDINGNKTAPNALGKDKFGFVVDISGKLIPFGGNSHAYLYGKTTPAWSADNGNSTTYGAAGVCNASGATGVGLNCAGSIFDNNLKVIYK